MDAVQDCDEIGNGGGDQRPGASAAGRIRASATEVMADSPIDLLDHVADVCVGVRFG
ncbi:hypothetical protein NHF48_018930 [Sphingomonas sp. H160509]|uniref:hypothetical protein n=1 Tax=Sphingomonas sp. H160509 TaxID=2955313 RepID=UPI002097F005|nr:hypothetical protein [Sphingomonas sp. H160509]MDD1452532.1 hypothetical protein [Sphingomonas sp. H160509]